MNDNRSGLYGPSQYDISDVELSTAGTAALIFLAAVTMFAVWAGKALWRLA